MSKSNSENITKLPQTVASKERLATRRLELVQSFDELIAAVEAIGSFPGSLMIYSAEDVLHDLSLLLSQLNDLKVADTPPVCDLTEFTSALGLRQTIGRLLIQQGYQVNPDVFAEPDPPQAG